MKTTVTVGIVSAVFAVMLFLVFRTTLENDRLEHLLKLTSSQHELLEDQLREYEYKASTTPTYEQGVHDAIVKAAGGSYTDGYAAAKSLYEAKNYADGYHNAITQFGYTVVDRTKSNTINASSQSQK